MSLIRLGVVDPMPDGCAWPDCLGACDPDHARCEAEAAAATGDPADRCDECLVELPPGSPRTTCARCDNRAEAAWKRRADR